MLPRKRLSLEPNECGRDRHSPVVQPTKKPDFLGKGGGGELYPARALAGPGRTPGLGEWYIFMNFVCKLGRSRLAGNRDPTLTPYMALPIFMCTEEKNHDMSVISE